MKKKPGKVFIDRISLRVYYFRYSFLFLLKQSVVSNLDLLFKYQIYFSFYEMYAFFSKLQNFCYFSARPRGVYFKFISRYKLRRFQDSGILVGLKKLL